MRVHEERQSGSKSQRGKWEHLAWFEQQPGGTAFCLQHFTGGLKHRSIPSQFNGDHQHCRDDRDVNQNVLNESDHRGGTQTALVGIDRQNDKGDDQGEFASAETQTRDHDLNSDQLEGDIWHRRDETRDRDRHRQGGVIETRPHEIGCSKVSPFATSTPEPRHDGKNKRVDDDRVRNSKKPVGSDAIDQGWDRDHGVRRVKVSAHQEPGNSDSEPLAHSSSRVRSPAFQRAAMNPSTVTSKKRPIKTARAIQ